MAAEEDDRRRIWTHEHFKAIFECKQAIIDTNGPVGNAQHQYLQLPVKRFREKNLCSRDYSRKLTYQEDVKVTIVFMLF